jgi:hypothetical protein
VSQFFLRPCPASRTVGVRVSGEFRRHPSPMKRIGTLGPHCIDGGRGLIPSMSRDQYPSRPASFTSRSISKVLGVPFDVQRQGNSGFAGGAFLLRR